MNKAINLNEKVSRLTEHWSPRIIGEVDDNYVKIAKLKGSLAWHKHDNEDELFIVIDGSLSIEFEDRTVILESGDMYIVPKGVMHNPVAKEECSVLLVEKKSTRHTGDLNLEQTKSVEDQSRPI